MNAPIKSKRCGRCGEIKPISEFYQHIGHRDGLASTCKKCDKERNKKYYESHIEKAKESSRKWYRNNVEHAKEQSRRWREANPEKRRQALRKWRERNREKDREKTRRRYLADPEYFKRTGAKKRARIKKQWLDILGSMGMLACMRCGYNRTFAALDYHHIGEKGNGIARLLNLVPTTERVNEVKRTICLCSNCHRELHAGEWNLEEALERVSRLQ